MVTKIPAIDFIKSEIKELRRLIALKGYIAPYSTFLEVSANVLGYKDFNVYAADLKKHGFHYYPEVKHFHIFRNLGSDPQKSIHEITFAYKKKFDKRGIVIPEEVLFEALKEILGLGEMDKMDDPYGFKDRSEKENEMYFQIHLIKSWMLMGRFDKRDCYRRIISYAISKGYLPQDFDENSQDLKDLRICYINVFNEVEAPVGEWSLCHLFLQKQKKIEQENLLNC